MRFRDIEQFFQANYAVDVSWTHLEQTLNDYTHNHGLELWPDFQRGHVWTEDQQSAYVEYVLRGGMSGKDIFFNHPGWMRDWKGNMVCVDGLQRLTAVRLFMANGLRILDQGYTLNDFEDKPDLITARFRFHVNDLRKRKDVLKWYLDFNSGGTVHTQDELDRVQSMLMEAESNDE